MPAAFVVVPEWQGSVSARAMSHADGAHAISGDLPSAATVLVDVPVEAESNSKERIEEAKNDWRQGRFDKVFGDEKDFIPMPE